MNRALRRVHAQIPCGSPRRSMHSRRKPNRALMSAAYKREGDDKSEGEGRGGRDRVRAREGGAGTAEVRGSEGRARSRPRATHSARRAPRQHPGPAPPRPAPPPPPHHTHLVVAPDQVDGGGVLNLEGQQQADGLQGVGAPVDIVAQEEVVDVGDVASRAGRAVLLKQAHEVPKLAVQVAEDFDGG